MSCGLTPGSFHPAGSGNFAGFVCCILRAFVFPETANPSLFGFSLRLDGHSMGPMGVALSLGRRLHPEPCEAAPPTVKTLWPSVAWVGLGVQQWSGHKGHSPLSPGCWPEPHGPCQAHLASFLHGSGIQCPGLAISRPRVVRLPWAAALGLQPPTVRRLPHSVHK